MLAIGLVVLLFSCAGVKMKVPEVKLPKGAGPLYQIQYSPNNPKTTVGGSIVLTARGVDKDGREVDINPTWKCGSEGKVEPAIGKKVTFTALKSGVCFIDVSQGNVTTTIAVEIK
jgi:hypothetical protein